MKDATDLLETLAAQAREWHRRPLLRRIYGEWYRMIVGRLSSVPGDTIDLGSGIGRMREVKPDVILTDIQKTAWADICVDATELPYADSSLANISMLDVFHHLSDPARFLDEAVRALRPGGRIVMIEPYCSPVSTAAYRRFHHERTDLAADPFRPDPAVAAAPLASNQALPTLLFFHRRDEFSRRWPSLRIVDDQRFAFLAYPLSGGFSGRRLLPAWLYAPLRVLESVLSPLADLLAFRCMITLEKVVEVKHESASP